VEAAFHLRPAHAQRLDIHPNHVGLDLVEVDAAGETMRKSLSELPGEDVILDETLPAGEGDPGCRRDDTGLPHAPAHPLAQVPDLGDDVGGTADDRPAPRPQSTERRP